MEVILWRESEKKSMNSFFQISKVMDIKRKKSNEFKNNLEAYWIDFYTILKNVIFLFLVNYKRKMQPLLQYLFKQYISEETSTIIKRLYKLQPLSLNTSLQILPADLQLLQYLIAKNFVTYSPAHLQIRLNSYAVLFYQRVYKIKKFAEKHTHPHFSQLLNDFISNQLLPVPFSSKHLNALLNPSQRMVPEGKGKKKKQDEVVHHKDELDYSRLIYEYSQKA